MYIPPRLKTCLAVTPFTTILAIFTCINRSQAQACAAGSAQEMGGNWYCSEVKAIKYQNFPGHGFYNRITGMDAVTGQCVTEKHAYSGSLSPLNEELSLHIRGPTRLKKLAVYVVGDTADSPHKRQFEDVLDGTYHHDSRKRHANLHHSVHARRRQAREEAEKRAEGDLVVATINGQVVSWKNTYTGPSVAPNPVPIRPVDAVGNAVATLSSNAESAPTAVGVKDASKLSSGGKTPESTYKGGSGWNRVAYYDAAGATSTGLTFLNHFGGTNGIPGTVAGGPAFGASLSYASSDGGSGSGTSQTLEDVLIDDGIELIVLSDNPCKGSDCGYTRPGGVAYHGFGGSQKIFLMEFAMPMSGKRGFNGDMPGIWLLNAQIPLTSQYGTNPQCSCWTSGCGEFDLFEVLDSGNFRCKSTLHMAPAGGSSDWFQRPVKDTITAAVVFAGGDDGILVKVLDGAQDFGGSIDDKVVQEWLEAQCSTFKMQT